MKRLLLILAFLAAVHPAVAADKDKIHRLALQISDNTPEKMTAVLNVAANVSRHYSEVGEEVEIRIVAFNAGLNMLRMTIAKLCRLSRRLLAFSSTASLRLMARPRLRWERPVRSIREAYQSSTGLC